MSDSKQPAQSAQFTIRFAHLLDAVDRTSTQDNNQLTLYWFSRMKPRFTNQYTISLPLQSSRVTIFQDCGMLCVTPSAATVTARNSDRG